MQQSESTLNQVFQRVECILSDHNQRIYQNRIIEVCMQVGCNQSNILCGHCKVLHNDHRDKLVNVAEIEEAFIELKNEQQYDPEQIKLQKIIEEFESLARKKSKELINNLKQIINPLSSLEKIIMKNKQQSYYELQNQIAELQKLLEFDGKVKLKQYTYEINIHINNMVNQYLFEIENFWLGQGIFNQQLQSIWNDQQQQENFAQLQKINNFQFSQINCSESIQCITPYIARNISYDLSSNNCDLAYLNRGLQQYESVSLVFQIKCLNREGLIGLGISQNQKVKYNQFNWWSDNLDKGYYLALSDGSSYNSDYSNYNGWKSNFKMVEDQQYRLKFDPQSKDDRQFTLEQVGYEQNKITMPMKIDYIYHYSIFAYLKGPSSEIELVQES